MSEAENMKATAGVGAADPAPGRRLAEARQAQNLTPADVARQLKLSVSQVEALEAGLYQRLPGPIFVRGFIRNYARLVKLDPDELLHAAADSLPQSTPRPEMPPSRDIPFPPRNPPRWPIYASVAAAIVGVLAVYEFFWNRPETTIAQPGVTTAPPAAPQSNTMPPHSMTALASSSSSVESHEKAVQPAIGAEAVATTAQDAPPPATAEAQQEPDKLPRAGERQVRLVFSEESWVEIRDRNEKVIFSQLNRPGTRQLINGLPPFSIVVGNAHGVRLTYEDKAVDLARHTKIDVARLILQ